jgi:hypothetical protein
MAKKWIQGAIQNKGALRKELGVKEGQTIPQSKLEEAAQKGGTLGRRARLAMTLRRLRSRAKKSLKEARMG